MRKFLYLSALFLVSMALFIAGWVVVFNIMNHYGFNNQATPFYGFSSGPGPMVETAVFGSTIITGLWHNLNCHDDMCFRIGRHKVNGTPYCNKHHHSVRHHATAEELLESISSKLDRVLGVTADGEAPRE